jgi:hypothetical protein
MTWRATRLGVPRQRLAQPGVLGLRRGWAGARRTSTRTRQRLAMTDEPETFNDAIRAEQARRQQALTDRLVPPRTLTPTTPKEKTMPTDKPRRRDLLPACVLEDAPDRVKETEATFAAALDTLDSARDDARRLAEAADAAPDADAQADLEAKRAGRKLPKPTAPDLDRERDAAQRLAAVAMQEATAARSVRDDAIAAHLDDLIAALAGRSSDTDTELVDGIDRLAALFDTRRVQSAALAALHLGDRRWQAAAKTVGGVDVASLLAQLKAAVESQARNTAPLTTRILAAVGQGPTS